MAHIFYMLANSLLLPILLLLLLLSHTHAGKKCSLIDLQRQQLERIVNLSDEALRLRVMNLHSYVFLRKQRDDARLEAERRAAGEC